MNAGIEILLARMKTHPEEFYRTSRWSHLFNDFLMWFSDEDKIAYENGIAECRRTEFNEIVMTRLAGEENEEKDLLGMSLINPQIVAQNNHLVQLQRYNNAQNSAINQLTNQQSTQLQQGTSIGLSTNGTTTGVSGFFGTTTTTTGTNYLQRALELDMSVDEYVRKFG